MPWHDREGRLADPEPEDLESWLTLPEVAGLVPGGITPALAQTLYQRLATRELVAAARIARWEAAPGKFWPAPCITIDPSWWRAAGDVTPDHPFWAHGDIHLVVPARGGAQNTPVQFCDVRFERSGLEGLVPGLGRQPRATPLAEAPSASQRDGPREWISAADAVDLVLPLYDRPNLAQTALIAEAAGDRLATRCERFEHEAEYSARSGVFSAGSELEFKFWRDFEHARREREDWLAGAFVFYVGDTVNGRTWTRAFGVEFCANDVRRVFRLREPSFAVFPVGALQATSNPRGGGEVWSSGAKAASPQGTVSAEDAWAWFRALPPEDQRRPWRWLWPEVRKAFEPRRVLKKHALEFVKDRRLGRPPKVVK